MNTGKGRDSEKMLRYFDIAMRMAGIAASAETTELLWELSRCVARKKGNCSIKDVVEIKVRVNEKYAAIAASAGDGCEYHI